jgi:nucleoside-triphosphatase
MPNKIYILSDAVRSGKSTLLYQLCRKKKSVAGFVCRDIHALRYFIDMDTGNTFPMQKKISTKKDDVIIGRYIFDNRAFVQAKKILQQLHTSEKEWIVIDEIGKLEYQDKGYEPELSLFLHQIVSMQNKNIVMIIRDYLLDECMIKYSLQHAIVLNVEAFKKHFLL